MNDPDVAFTANEARFVRVILENNKVALHPALSSLMAKVWEKLPEGDPVPERLDGRPLQLVEESDG